MAKIGIIIPKKDKKPLKCLILKFVSRYYFITGTNICQEKCKNTQNQVYIV